MDAGDAGPLENGADATDVFGFSSNASRENKSSANWVVQKEAYFYKMDHPRRGIAVIFNHERFLVPNLKDRTGTQADCDNLKGVWEKLGFTVVVHQDLGIKALTDEIDSLSKMDFSQMDCLVVCVLSHGEEGVIFSRDTAYKHETLWQKFTADNCKSLAGKPKLFFIQACQGRRLDPGIELRTNAEVDGAASSYKIPVHADFLFAYSTIPGKYFSNNHSIKKKKSHLSYLNCFTRSLSSEICNESIGCDCNGTSETFSSILCNVLKQDAFNFDLVMLLTFVNGEFYEDSMRRPPYFYFTLTRRVIFKPPLENV